MSISSIWIYKLESLPLLKMIRNPKDPAENYINIKPRFVREEIKSKIIYFKPENIQNNTVSNIHYQFGGNRFVLSFNVKELIQLEKNFEGTSDLFLNLLDAEGSYIKPIKGYYGVFISTSTKIILCDSPDDGFTFPSIKDSYFLLNTFRSKEHEEKILSIIPNEITTSLISYGNSIFQRKQNKDLQNPLHQISSILLSGPSGSGCTTIVKALSRHFNTNLLVITAGSIFCRGGNTADSSLYEAFMCGVALEPCIVLIDDLHNLLPYSKKSSSSAVTDVEISIKKVLKSFLKSLDKTKHESIKISIPSIMVICCTYDQVLIDQNVQDYFSEKIQISLPTGKDRKNLIKEISQHKKSQINNNLKDIESSNDEIYEISDQLISLPFLTSYIEGVKKVENLQENNKRNENIRPPGNKDIFEGIYGLNEAKQILIESFIWPRKYFELFSNFGITMTTGLLLYGPPGTGKTLLPRSLSKQLKTSFINIQLTDIITGTIGTSESKLVQFFHEAKQSAPAIIFIDEFQAIFTERQEKTNSSPTGSSLSSTLATCFDDINVWNKEVGIDSQVFVLAATNEPWAIDKGFLRPGRLEKSIFIGPFDRDSRAQFIRDHLHETDEVERRIEELVGRTEGFTGADMALLLVKARTEQWKEGLMENNGVLVSFSHFSTALVEVERSIPQSEIEEYLRWKK